MSEEVNKKVEQIKNFFRKNHADSHPIRKHPISKCDEYVKGLYFDMLCVIAQYENEDIENQNKFIQRIMAGSGETMPVAEHIKRAMSITPENMAEFIKQCRDNKLNEIFFIDALIIACGNGTPNKKQVEFLAEIADVLGFDKDKINFLSQSVLAVLEHDLEKLKKSFCEYEYEPDIENLLRSADCYIKPFIDSFVINTDRKIHYFALKKIKPLFTKAENKKACDYDVNIKDKDEVILENQLIDRTSIHISSVKKIKFIDCDFINSTIKFVGTKYIEIENCIFRDYVNDENSYPRCYVFDFHDKGKQECNVNIKNSVFKNTENEIFYSLLYEHRLCENNITNINFESCKFEKIFNSYRKSYSGTAIACADVINVSNCTFINCKGAELFRVNKDYKTNNNKFTDSTKERR